MLMASEQRRYSTAAIVLHWAIAALLVFQVSLGWQLEELAKGAAQFEGYQLHKSVGITILALSVLRVLVRLVASRPAPSPATPAVALLVKVVHFGFYAVMLIGPLTGWILVSTAKIKLQTMLFGVVPLPALPLGQAWHEPAEAMHGALGWVTVALFVLHVGGALRHHMLCDDVLGRMIPARTRGGLLAGAVVALLATVALLAAAKFWPFGAHAAAVAPAASAAASEAVDADGDRDEQETAPAEAGASAAPAASAAAEASAGADAASAVPWRLERGGKLGFRVDYSGSPVVGRFDRWDAQIVFSPEDLAHSRVKVTVDLASVASGDGERDEMLRSDRFFGVAAHPSAVFSASRFTRQRPGRYAAAGTLSINGRAVPSTLRFDLAIDGDRASASGALTISRTAFAVGSGEWAATGDLADKVAVDFALTARRAG